MERVVISPPSPTTSRLSKPKKQTNSRLLFSFFYSFSLFLIIPVMPPHLPTFYTTSFIFSFYILYIFFYLCYFSLIFWTKNFFLFVAFQTHTLPYYSLSPPKKNAKHAHSFKKVKKRKKVVFTNFFFCKILKKISVPDFDGCLFIDIDVCVCVCVCVLLIRFSEAVFCEGILLMPFSFSFFYHSIKIVEEILRKKT
jgi:hypothetical protein